MCGITGIHYFGKGNFIFENELKASVNSLVRRGPDNQSYKILGAIGLGHTRLSIIEPSEKSNQPMTDDSGRYTIVFNGEIFNYKSLRFELEKNGETFSTDSDTEVLLKLYISKGNECLQELNGFFAFAIHDNFTGSTFIARDRFGVKPLVYFIDSEKLIFASEIKAILAYGIPKKIYQHALRIYLRLTYIPAPYTIYENVKKLLPGQAIVIDKNEIKIEFWHKNNLDGDGVSKSYESSKKQLHDCLEDSVVKRLVADVPLGCFLSGGLDSSIIAALAAKHKNNLHTFSVGYKDEPFFDETKYAEIVAKKIGSNHHVFNISNKDLFENLSESLDYMDEPFADSSALAVNILCKKTKNFVKVSLSGDGADELFGGYNKHRALFESDKKNILNSFVFKTKYFMPHLEGSRNNLLKNKLRQIEKYSKILNLNAADKYWELACWNEKKYVDALLKKTTVIEENHSEFTRKIQPNHFNSYLLTDVELVLPNDMLFKVDSMSMCHGLEVRTPFLDYRVVAQAMAMETNFKIDDKVGKKILRDTFSDYLPKEIITRAKKGFEVPLKEWISRELKSQIIELFHPKLIEKQGIFNQKEIDVLMDPVRNGKQTNQQILIYTLFVFQYWWNRNFNA